MKDFYVGYEPAMPPRLGRFMRRLAVVLLLGAAGLAALLAMTQREFDPGVFEFGLARDFEGRLASGPYPQLLVSRPGQVTEGSGYSTYHLVAVGKSGADHLVRSLTGQQVRAHGQLIYRDDQTMIEVVQVEKISSDKGADSMPESVVPLGPVQLNGEIVDSKCYLGVMKPGRRKTHRDCAVRCISGGMPPLLVVAGNPDPTHYLLVASDGSTLNQSILDRIAEPVQVRGELEAHGDLMVIRVDSEQITRLP